MVDTAKSVGGVAVANGKQRMHVKVKGCIMVVFCASFSGRRYNN